MILVKFSEDFGRHGDLEGLFTCSQEDYDKVIGRKVYLGDVLGKHSSVEIELTTENMVIQQVDQAFIEQFDRLLPYGSGIDPIGAALDQIADEESTRLYLEKKNAL